MKRVKISPLKQGHLDGLCGIYATINAIRLALGDEERRYKRSDWEELFYSLLAVADDEIGAVRAVACGMTGRPFRKVLTAGVEYMRDEHEVMLSASRLIEPQTKPSV